MTQTNASRIRRRRAILMRQEEKLAASIALLKDQCKHPTPHYTYFSNTGNYDPSSDAYWIDWTCPDCGKKWTTDQSQGEVSKYPGAIQIRK